VDRQWSGDDYFLVRTGRGAVSFYPVATGLMAIPVYLVPVPVTQARGDPTPAEWIDFEPNYEILAAALITALSIVAFWRLCRALAFGPWLALGLTALYGFGSEAFAISAQALWQHGPGSLAVILLIGAFVDLDRRHRGAALLLSLCAAGAIAIRLNNALLVVLVLLLRHPALLGERLVLALGLGTIATAGLNVGFHAWWGGHGFGPRYFAECERAILLVIGIALTRLSAPARLRTSLLCFAVLLPYSVFVQAVGFYLPAAHQWDATPRSVDDAHERLWDVGDNPVLRGLRGAPPAGG